MNLNFFQDSNFKIPAVSGPCPDSSFSILLCKGIVKIFLNLCIKKEACRPLFLFKQFRLFFFFLVVTFDGNGIESGHFIVAFQFLDLDA